MDGCFENLKTLKQVIKQQRKHRKEISIVFLDLAKPFNTISHKSIRKGLMRKGVHVQVIWTIKEMQVQVIQLQSTEISVGGKAIQKIKINSAVKQGCPLSPPLFNLVMDELIEKLKSKNIGVKINGTLLSVMAFADDLVIVTEENVHIKILLEECKQFFDMKGLAVNAGKCASLRVLPVKCKRIDESGDQNPQILENKGNTINNF